VVAVVVDGAFGRRQSGSRLPTWPGTNTIRAAPGLTLAQWVRKSIRMTVHFCPPIAWYWLVSVVTADRPPGTGDRR